MSSQAETRPEPAAEPQIFRPQALEYRRRPSDDEGRPLRVTPAWLDSAYRWLLVLGVLAMAVLLVGPTTEYATGPAIVRLAERFEVAARASGTLGEILVAPGDRVVAGQLLGRLEAAGQQAEVEKLRREFELLLIERLRAPRGAPSPAPLSALQEEKRLAEARLERLSLRTLQPGVVGDVLVRVGKPVVAGQRVFTVITPSPAARPAVVALLPGRYRPLLKPGMSIRLELEGYRDGAQRLTIDHVGASVVDPAEAGAIVGQTVGGTEPAAGGFIVVRATLPATHFEARGGPFEYYDGLLGTAEVPVRKRRLASLLVPGAADG